MMNLKDELFDGYACPFCHVRFACLSHLEEHWLRFHYHQTVFKNDRSVDFHCRIKQIMILMDLKTKGGRFSKRRTLHLCLHNRQSPLILQSFIIVILIFCNFY
ncbi:uncharacterized protein LOC143227185 [Tachypleus tridentatus]|uniref:uncharacterized protein LOC143227185 n=1 Tax=Tachypleus tridentatus TaxID=6853 RepID=UPI003FCFF031